MDATMKPTTKIEHVGNLPANHEKVHAHDKLVTAAIARYARRHNEFDSTVRHNLPLKAAAIAEWNAAVDAGAGPSQDDIRVLRAIAARDVVATSQLTAGLGVAQ